MSTSPYIADVDQNTFVQQVLEKSHQLPVLVDFWAAWCSPCKMLMPLLAKIADEYEGKFFLAKVDTDVERGLAEQFGVRSLPTVKVFRFGEIVDEFAGVIPESNIRELIDNYIVRESDGYYAEAMSALEAGDITTAQEKMQIAMDQDPDRKNILLGMVEIYLMAGSVNEAETLLNKLPINLQNDEEVEALRSRLMFASGTANAPAIATLENNIANNPKDVDSLFQLGSCYASNGEYEKALETFLKLLIVDKGYKDNAARKAMLSIFNILGGGPLVNLYRSKMASALM